MLPELGVFAGTILLSPDHLPHRAACHGRPVFVSVLRKNLRPSDEAANLPVDDTLEEAMRLS